MRVVRKRLGRGRPVSRGRRQGLIDRLFRWEPLCFVPEWVRSTAASESRAEQVSA
jgi:hypothetical protein